MRGKTKESHYLITKLFATDYFYFYCKPLLFFTYFFPYQISKNGQFSTYEEFEYEKKMNDIREEKFGKYGNYASQGFGNIAFYKPCVTFQYFYNKLCLYQKEKNKFFCIREDGIQDIEDNIMKEDLKYILKDKKLLLKKNMFIPNGVKEILLLQLEKYENKYVLSELLYYIVSENHMLPDIDAERLKQHQKQFSDKKDEFRLNICMNLREKMDEDRKNLVEKLVHAKAIQMVCINGNSLLKKNEQNITLLEEIIEQKKKNNEKNLNLEIIFNVVNNSEEKQGAKLVLSKVKDEKNITNKYELIPDITTNEIMYSEETKIGRPVNGGVTNTSTTKINNNGKKITATYNKNINKVDTVEEITELKNNNAIIINNYKPEQLLAVLEKSVLNKTGKVVEKLNQSVNIENIEELASICTTSLHSMISANGKENEKKIIKNTIEFFMKNVYGHISELSNNMSQDNNVIIP